jgi:hypothetical protein
LGCPKDSWFSRDYFLSPLGLYNESSMLCEVASGFLKVTELSFMFQRVTAFGERHYMLTPL